MNNVFYQFLNSLTPELVLLNFQFSVGTTGAVSATIGSGITSVTRLGVGVYRILLDSKYNRLMSVMANVIPPVTGSAIADGSLTATTLYRITTVGTTDFTASGALRNVVGEAFVATGIGGAGSGTATEIAPEQCQSIQLASTVQDSVQDFTIVCVDDAGAIAEVASGAKVFGTILLRNSTLSAVGE